MAARLGLARRGALALRRRHRSRARGRELRSAVDRALVLCFGLLHDTRRENEAVDPGHGARAEAFALELRDEGALALDDERFRVLCEALRLHSDGLVSEDATIGACWDADRLHLPRVSIQPDPQRFSTARRPR